MGIRGISHCQSELLTFDTEKKVYYYDVQKTHLTGGIKSDLYIKSYNLLQSLWCGVQKIRFSENQTIKGRRC